MPVSSNEPTLPALSVTPPSGSATRAGHHVGSRSSRPWPRCSVCRRQATGARSGLSSSAARGTRAGGRAEARLTRGGVGAGIKTGVTPFRPAYGPPRKFAECLDGKWAGRFPGTSPRHEARCPTQADQPAMNSAFDRSPGSYAATARRGSDVTCRKRLAIGS
jgi:hypothetical protein